MHRLVFAVLTAGVLAFGLLQSLVLPVLPTIQQALDTNQSDVTWVLTANLLAASIFTPIVGRSGDLNGKKRVFVVALLTVALGCLLSALASSLGLMIVGRVLQGVGGGLLPLAFGILRDEFPDAHVPSAVSAIAAVIALGSGLGLVLAGPIVDLLGPDWLFWLPLAVLVLAAVAACFIPESRSRAAGTINWPAALLLAGWLVALLLPVSKGSAWGWTSPAVLGLLAAAVVLVVLWVVVESRSRVPLIDMRMMRQRAVWTINLVGLLIGAAVYGAYAFLPQFLQTPPSVGYGFGASVTESGLMLIPWTVASFLVGVGAGPIGQWYGSKKVLIVGIGVAAAGFLLFSPARDHAWAVYLMTTTIGIGLGAAVSSMATLVVAAVPQEQTGVASGMNANIRNLGGSIGAAVMAMVVTAHLGPAGRPAEVGYTNGFLLLTALLVLAVGAALVVPARNQDPVSLHEPDGPLLHPVAGLAAGGTLVGGDPE